MRISSKFGKNRGLVGPYVEPDTVSNSGSRLSRANVGRFNEEVPLKGTLVGPPSSVKSKLSVFSKPRNVATSESKARSVVSKSAYSNYSK